MAKISLTTMRQFLAASLSSLNENKLLGLLAEIELRQYLASLGYGTRVSPGGWITRSTRSAVQYNFVCFPQPVVPDVDYGGTTDLIEPSAGMHAVSAEFHRAGIQAFACSATVGHDDDTTSIQWYAKQLGGPTVGGWALFPDCIQGFTARTRTLGLRTYTTDTTRIPAMAVPEEFAKEHIRIVFQRRFFRELSDVDGVFFGTRVAYPLEVKAKARAADPGGIGDYFGLDVGPFVKLAFYAANRGTLSSIFVVKEVSGPARTLVNWWYATFESIAKSASWVPMAGGRSMSGGASSVVRIPLTAFSTLDATALAAL